MGKKIFAEISKKYFGVGPVLVQGGPDLVQGGPLLVQGGPLLVQPKVSSTGYGLDPQAQTSNTTHKEVVC